MLDPQRLLDSFLGSGRTVDGNGQNRPASAGTGSGGLGDLLNGNVGKYATGAAVGGIAAMLLGSKGVRKLGGSVLRYGGAAVIGGLAYKAWQDWQARKEASPAAQPAEPPALPPSGGPFDLSAQRSGDGNDARLAVMRAMIAAAKVDGHIDADERRVLFERIAALSLDAEEKAFLMDELARPLDVAAIAALASSREQAAEIWLASRMVIGPEDPREKAYLEELARRLELPSDLIAHLNRQAATTG